MPAVGRRDQQLLEREDELARLAEALDAIQTGEGRLIVIAAPAGIGKTSLLDACAGYAAERQVEVLRVGGDELVMDSSFRAVQELLREPVRAAGGVPNGPARLAAPIFDGETGGAVGPGRAAAVLHGLYWLLADLSERAPLAVLIDDVHWLDPASGRFVRYLGGRIASLPVLLVVCLRPGEGATGFADAVEELATCRLRPAALSEGATARLVRDILGARAGEELCRACHESTGGNAFYLHQLLAALAVEPDRTPERVHALGGEAVRRNVLVRLARLGGECERLAEAVAVLGADAALRHAAALAGLSPARAEAAADRLRGTGVLAPDPMLTFVHPIVGEAVAQHLGSSRRAALHRVAARALSAEGVPVDRVAAHLLGAESYGEAWVVDVLRAAGRDALARGAPEAAVAYLKRAHAEPPAAGERLDVLVELGRAETYLPVANGFPALEQALTLATQPGRRAEIALELAAAMIGTGGDYRSAIRILEDVLRDAAVLPAAIVERIEAFLIAACAGHLAGARNLFARAIPRFEPAVRGEIADSVMLAALAMTGVVAGRPVTEAAALAEVALRDQRLADAWPALGGATIALTFSDKLAAAARHQDAAIAEARQRGMAPMFVQASVFRACTALRAGDLNIAEDLFQPAIDMAEEQGARLMSLLWFGGLLVERGRAPEAAAIMEPLDLGVDVLDTWGGVALLAERGLVRIAVGRLEAGVEDLLEADRRMVEAGQQLSVLLNWVATAVDALIQLGRHDRAVALAHRELRAATASSSDRRRGIALSLAGTLEQGDSGLALLQEGVQVLSRSPARLEHARALARLGAGLLARRRRDEARAVLSQALDTAHKLAAVALTEQVHGDLLATGARPRRHALSGPEALTPAELRTARMAADGLTNRQIARALFVSPRTVEAQLHQAYAKLAIAGREELTAALQPAAVG